MWIEFVGVPGVGKSYLRHKLHRIDRAKELGLVPRRGFSRKLGVRDWAPFRVLCADVKRMYQLSADTTSPRLLKGPTKFNERCDKLFAALQMTEHPVFDELLWQSALSFLASTKYLGAVPFREFLGLLPPPGCLVVMEASPKLVAQQNRLRAVQSGDERKDRYASAQLMAPFMPTVLDIVVSRNVPHVVINAEDNEKVNMRKIIARLKNE